MKTGPAERGLDRVGRGEVAGYRPGCEVASKRNLAKRTRLTLVGQSSAESISNGVYQLSDTLQEAGHRCSIYQAVIKGQAERYHGPAVDLFNPHTRTRDQFRTGFPFVVRQLAARPLEIPASEGISRTGLVAGSGTAIVGGGRSEKADQPEKRSCTFHPVGGYSFKTRNHCRSQLPPAPSRPSAEFGESAGQWHRRRHWRWPVRSASAMLRLFLCCHKARMVPGTP